MHDVFAVGELAKSKQFQAAVLIAGLAEADAK